MNLGVRVGQGCAHIMDEKMRNLDCRNIQVDEIWGFIQKRKKNIKSEDDPRAVGDAWTFCAIDADTKLVPAYKVGKRDSVTANAFISDLAGRLKNRIQLSSDCHFADWVLLRVIGSAARRGPSGCRPGGSDARAGLHPARAYVLWLEQVGY